MGYLYDVVRHWFEVERSFGIKLVWSRKIVDLINNYDVYEDESSYKTANHTGKDKCRMWAVWRLIYENHSSQNYSGHAVSPRAHIIKVVMGMWSIPCRNVKL